MTVERIKVLYKHTEWDEFSDGFKGELVTDTRWGLLYVIMGSSQGTLDPLSPTFFLFCLGVGKEGQKGRMPKVFTMGQAQAQAHREPAAHELVVLSLPVCSNPVLKHFLYTGPSLASSHVLPEALPTSRVIPFHPSLL
jgi:hypothetical protein